MASSNSRDSGKNPSTAPRAILNVVLGRNSLHGALLIDASKIVSDLVANAKFFKATMCEILNSVAQSIGVHNPTEEETEKFRKQLSCKIEIESMDNDYMQCAAGTGHIFINGSVHS